MLELTVRERPGVHCFRFWQEGGGYDRNLRSEVAILAAIDYIHENPVRRGLCKPSADWRWSSARHYRNECGIPDPGIPPTIHGLTRDSFVSGRSSGSSIDEHRLALVGYDQWHPEVITSATRREPGRRKGPLVY